MRSALAIPDMWRDVPRLGATVVKHWVAELVHRHDKLS